jgi:hypothetical protein
MCLGAFSSMPIDPDRQQRSSDVDCAKRGAMFSSSTCVASTCQSATPWGGLESLAWPTPPTEHVTATLDLADAILKMRVTGVSARVCLKLDATCSRPNLTNLVSHADGKLPTTVPSGFDGYIEQQSTNAIPGGHFFYPLIADRGLIVVATYYMVNEMPSSSSTVTDSQGYGGLVNIRSSTATSTGKVDTGKAIGAESILTRPGQVTYATIQPMPE